MNKRLILFLLYLYLIGIYLEIPLKLTNSSYIPGITILIQLPIVYICVKQFITKKDFLFIYKVTLLIVISILFARGIYGFENMSLKVAQFPASIFMGICLLKLSNTLDIESYRKVYYNLTILLFFGTILEYLKVIDGISLTVSNYLYTGTNYTPYDALERDIAMIGWQRPRFFTSEPSLLATGYFVFSSIYLIVNDSSKKFTQILIMNIVFIMISGSPIAILNLFISLFITSLVLNFRQRIYISASILLLPVAVSVIPIFQTTYTKYLNRIGIELFETGSSIYARFNFPYLIGIPRALEHNLFWGVGYAGKDLMFKLSNTGYSIKSGFSMDYIDGANAFARLFMYLGIFGAIFLIFTLIKYFKTNAKNNSFMFVIFWISFCQTLGTFETPRFWGYTFMIISAFTIKNRVSLNNSNSVSSHKLNKLNLLSNSKS